MGWSAGRDYCGFHLIATCRFHCFGSISISEAFRTIFSSNLVETVTVDHQSFLSQTRMEFSVEEIYVIRDLIQARQYHYEKGMGRRPFMGLWREEIVPFFGDSEGLILGLLRTLKARCQTALSGIVCLLTWHLSLMEVNCGLLMRKWREVSMHSRNPEQA